MTTVSQDGQTAERLVNLAATADFFPLMGVAPAHGRVFKPEEFEPGVDNVIVLPSSGCSLEARSV
jgi:hypothetical protein